MAFASSLTSFTMQPLGYEAEIDKREIVSHSPDDVGLFG